MSTLKHLRTVYAAITELVDSAGPTDLRMSTLAQSWTVRELLFHVLLDAQRALVTAATPDIARPDVDQVGYWASWRPSKDTAASAAHAAFVQRAAAAYSDDGLRAQWRDTSAAALRALRALGPSSRVRTQGHVLTVAAFTHTLLVEATVHLVDLSARLDAPPPPPAGLTAVRSVVEGLLGAPLPPDWDDLTVLLKGTGRARLDAADHLFLADAADRFPLFG